MIRRTSPLFATLVAALAGVLMAAVPEPEGFRLEDYRGPVPATVSGGSVLHVEQLRERMEHGGVVLIDVLPAARRPAGMRPGMPWLPVAHHDLPGSLWWPDVGRGAISPELELRFRARLAQVAAEHPDSMLVFYCQNDCWLSWNAAKRAASYGVEVAWFPEGADGWQAAGLPMQEAVPEFLE